MNTEHSEYYTRAAKQLDSLADESEKLRIDIRNWNSEEDVTRTIKGHIELHSELRDIRLGLIKHFEELYSGELKRLTTLTSVLDDYISLNYDTIKVQSFFDHIRRNKNEQTAQY